MKTTTTYSELLAKVFSNDILFQTMFKDIDDVKFEKSINWYFSYMVKYSNQLGHIITTPDEQGIVVWVEGKHFPIVIDENVLDVIPDFIAEKIEKLEVHEASIENYIANNAQNYGYIAFLAVAPEARRKGYGSKLLSEAKKEMKEKGIEYCWLCTENINNIRLYKENGFDLVDEFATNAGIMAYILNQKLSL